MSRSNHPPGLEVGGTEVASHRSTEPLDVPDRYRLIQVQVLTHSLRGVGITGRGAEDGDGGIAGEEADEEEAQEGDGQEHRHQPTQP